MDDSLLQRLFITNRPEEKAATLAESLFITLSEPTATIARQCCVFHWFDESIISVLMKDQPFHENQLKSIYGQIRSLPFVESLPWGVAYNSLTRNGLLYRYTVSKPDLLRTAARLAAPAYLARKEDSTVAAEAFFCYLVAGEFRAALELFIELGQFSSNHIYLDFVDNLLDFSDEVQQFFEINSPFSEIQKTLHKDFVEINNDFTSTIDTKNNLKDYEINIKRSFQNIGNYDESPLIDIQSTYQSLGTLVKASPFVYPQVKRSLSKAALRDAYPVWLLDPRGTIIAANLMAFWLYDRLPSDELPRPDTLLGDNALSILANNLRRIPVAENIELLAKSSALVKHAASEEQSSLYAPFIAAMRAHPGFAYIYDHFPPHPDHEWEYPLRIMPAGSKYSAQLLEFQVTHYRLEGDSGFLVTYVPTPTSLPVVESQYKVLMEQYGKHNYVVPDDIEQMHGETTPPSMDTPSFFRNYYPRMLQDPLWYIIEDNKANQVLLGTSAAGLHFFELFFTPMLKPWMGPIQDTYGPRAIQYFETFTENFRQSNHELHTAYLQVIERLQHVEDFQRMLAISHKHTLHLNMAEQPGNPFYTGRIILPWQPFPEVLLHFRSMVQLVYNGLLIHTDQPHYHVTLVPEDSRTEVALILSHLTSTAPMPGDATDESLRHLLWFLAILKTLKEGVSNGEGNLQWEPETAFARIHDELYKNSSYHLDNTTAKAAARIAVTNLIQSLEREYGIDQEFLAVLWQGFIVVNQHAVLLHAVLLKEFLMR